MDKMICSFHEDCIYKEQIKHLEEENAELRNNVLKECPNCGCEYLAPVGNYLYETKERLEKENAILKDTLREIKEPAYRLRTKDDYFSVAAVNADIDKILNKINEVLDE